MFKRMVMGFLLLAALSGAAMGATQSYFLGDQQLDALVKVQIAEVDSTTIASLISSGHFTPLTFMQNELSALLARVLPLIPVGFESANSVSGDLFRVLRSKVEQDVLNEASKASFKHSFFNQKYVAGWYEKYFMVELLKSLNDYSVSRLHEALFKNMLHECFLGINFIIRQNPGDIVLQHKVGDGFALFLSNHRLIDLGLWDFLIAELKGSKLFLIEVLKSIKDHDMFVK